MRAGLSLPALESSHDGGQDGKRVCMVVGLLDIQELNDFLLLFSSCAYWLGIARADRAERQAHHRTLVESTFKLLVLFMAKEGVNMAYLLESCACQRLSRVTCEREHSQNK